jgi:ATP-binding cassette, subfamily C (CFTR/MRP), member 1
LQRSILLLTGPIATHFHLADQVILLENSTVGYQGTWDDLATKPKQLLKFTTEGSVNKSDRHADQPNKNLNSQSLKIDEATSDLSRKTGDFSLYGLSQLIGYQNFLLLLFCTATYSFFVTFPQYWLKWWTEAAPGQSWFYIGGYIILSLMAWISTNGSMW